MFGYRHFITKLMLILGGRALKNLLQGIVDAKSQEQMVCLAQNSRYGLDNMRYWFKKNAQVAAPKKSIIEGVPVYSYESIARDDSSVQIILLHGGGFIIGSHQSHGALASELAAITKSMVHLVEYPLFPEVTMQEMLHTCKEVVHSLVDKKGLSRYVLFGDSVGGFLACQVIASRIQKQLQLPERVYLLSPLIQHCFGVNKKVVRSSIGTDDILGPTYKFVIENEHVKREAMRKLGCESLPEILDLEPEALGRFPPMHITYDSNEVLAWEIQAWIAKLKDANVSLVDNSVDNGFHAFAVYNYLPISKVYFSEIGEDYKRLVKNKRKNK